MLRVKLTFGNFKVLRSCEYIKIKMRIHKRYDHNVLLNLTVCVCVKQLTKHPNLNLKLQTKCFVWSSDNGINDSHWVNKDASKDHFLKATDINFVYSATMK